MSENPTPGKDTEPDEALAGMRLGAARRALDISVFEIAKELHLDEPKVRALEENNFDVLGAPVFAKGHLRKYAELVGVDTDDVLADYYSLNRAVGAPPVVGVALKQRREVRLGSWIAGFFVIALLAAIAVGGYWWLERSTNEAVSQADTPALAPFVSAAGEAGVPVEETSDSPTAMDDAGIDGTSVESADDEDAIIDTEMAESTPNVVIGPSPGVASDVPQVTLSISFSGDCWTEVSDASGKRLYFELGSAGRSASVTGAAPLRALFGDSSNVRLTVDGQDYPITDSMRSGRTARMTINAQ
jgi:cytoskeleton protein RodZ